MPSANTCTARIYGSGGTARGGTPRRSYLLRVDGDGEGGGPVLDVDEVVALDQVVEGHRADRRALTGFRQRVGPDAEARLRAELVAALLCAGDRGVGEDGVGHRELRAAVDVVGLEHDPR